jgi:membrane dipeptidase
MTSFGRRVVAECNRLGIVIDLSHASVASMHDTLSASKAPVVWSHSNAMALCNDARNVPDDVLARVRDNGGMVTESITK